MTVREALDKHPINKFDGSQMAYFEFISKQSGSTVGYVKKFYYGTYKKNKVIAKENINKKGEVVSQTIRYEPNDIEETIGFSPKQITSNPYGGQWVKYEKDNKLDAELILSNLKEKFSDFNPPKFEPSRIKYERNCVVINMYDAHLDKIAIKSSTGISSSFEDNMVLYMDMFKNILTLVESKKPELIIFPQGNDLFHTNDNSGRTKRGTQIEYYCSPQETYEEISILVTKTIALCLDVAPVYIPFIKGNHDEDKVHTLGFWTGQVFKNSPHFRVDNTRMQRKYYHYGENLLGFAHGDKEKNNINQLPLIMAEEQKLAWADTKYRKFYCGDLHHNFEYKFMKGKDYVGCNVEFLRSVGTTDQYHVDNGWMGIPKTGYAHVWNYSKGNTANYQENV